MSSQLATTTRAPATPATPVTPAAQRQHEATPTGKWKHPNFDEITRRQHAATFDDRNIRTIVVNTFFLAASWAAFNSTPKMPVLRALQTFMIHYKDAVPYANFLVGAIRVLFLYNILMAVRPLILRYSPDEMVDIPLTPSQRKAMGLDPNVATPQTPGTAYASPNYVTPPRYQKSTPRSSFGTPGDRQSPLSGSPRGGFGMSTSHSPFSPASGSPLFQKAFGGSAQQRMSLNGRSSPFENSSFFMDSTSSHAPSTPTPGMGKASVGLNNKWLYEKRRDSRGSGMFS